jgi:anti-anti-sigma regulatory factor
VLFQLLAAAVRDGVALVIRDPSGSAARQIARLGLRDILVVEEPA